MRLVALSFCFCSESTGNIVTGALRLHNKNNFEELISLTDLTAVFRKQTRVGVQLERNFCHVIATLSVVLSQLNLTKLKLEKLKSGFRCKK